MKKTQMKQLEVAFQEMDDLLEKILHIQFGIQDKEWLDAIRTIEDGYTKALAYIRKQSANSAPIDSHRR